MNEVQTTEATGKRWKAMLLGGSVAAVCGLLIALAGIPWRDMMEGEPNLILVVGGLSICFLGLGAATVAKIGAWWYHG